MARDTQAIDRSIPFVDAHHHLWQLDRLTYPWLSEPGSPGQTAVIGEYRAFRVDWLPSRLKREFYGQGVVKTVHVEAACVPDQAVAETEWLDELAAVDGLPNALVVFADLTKPGVERELDRHLEASSFVRGVRARPELPADPDFLRGFEALADRPLSYEFSASPGALMAGLGLAARAPETQIILGHTGFPLQRDRGYFELWRREMRALAEAPNVAVKVSGLGMVDHEWTVDSFRPWVTETIEAFGVDRVMFGTNWPVDSLFSPYFELIDAYRQILADAGFDRGEQAAMLHGNAERIYRL